MTYTVLFIITLIAVSGLIAYSGDILGRRMGKRRLTIFGLRPRHTAIIMTTITGMLIAGLTFATMISVSSSLRQVLVRGERIMKDIANYQAQNKDLQMKNAELTATRASLRDEVQEKAKQVGRARKEVEAAVSARNDAQNRAEALEADIAIKQKELVRLTKSGELTEASLKRVSTDLEARKKELDDVRDVLVKKEVELSEKLNDLLQKSSELVQKQRELDQADQDIARAESTIKQHEELIREQQMQLGQAFRLTNLLLTGDVVIEQGQEIGRKVIDSSLTPKQIKAELVNLLDKAGKKAARAGAGSKDGSRAIHLIHIDKDTGALNDDKDAGIDAAVEAITEAGLTSDVPGVLAQLIVINNTLKGETAIVTLRLYWNSLKFRRGETIASRVIDGRMSEGRILMAVNDFLGEDVRSAAEKVGVVPVASPDPEDVDEPMSGGQLDDLMELVQKIRSRNSNIELHARAKKDIYAVGPLNLDNIQFAISELRAAK